MSEKRSYKIKRNKLIGSKLKMEKETLNGETIERKTTDTVEE